MENTKDDVTRFASIVAHQLKSPVSSAGSLLKTLIDGFAGELTAQQKDLLERADSRIEEALATSQRLLAIVRPESLRNETGTLADASLAARRCQARYSEEAARRDVNLTVKIKDEPLFVKATESHLTEALNSLISNALKYTPDNGSVHVTVGTSSDGGAAELSVADSGIGVSEENREKIFEPFYRTLSASGSSRPGVGLGLAFVKSLITALEGSVKVLKSSELGGAEFVLTLPLAERIDVKEAGESIERRKKVVIIGGVAAGPKVASKIVRLNPNTDVTIIEKGDVLSYAGCGFPYYVSGVVKEQKELLSTPVGTVRDPVFFQNIKQVVTMNRTEAVEIDRKEKRVKIVELKSRDESWVGYDTLVLATGSKPVIPKLPGVELKNIFTLHGIHDAEGIKSYLSGERARDVVIVGGGLIGVEITEALAARGCRVTIIESQPQILGMLDWEIAKLTENRLEAHGVKVRTGETVKRFIGDGKVTAVETDKERITADMVIIAVGVKPEVSLARRAGVAIGPTGAIKVDERMRTSDPDIFAAGDCAEKTDSMTGKPIYIPLGSTANKEGRVAAMNICGRDDAFPGVCHSVTCKIFDYCVARTGMNEREATAADHKVVTTLTSGVDREHFMPGVKTLKLKLVVDKATRRLLGAQAVGDSPGFAKMDIVGVAITTGMTVDQLAHVDMCYAPSFSLAMDNLITAANVARNKLSGDMIGITPMEARRKLDAGEDFVFLDVRNFNEYEEVRLPGSTLIPLGALRGRLFELPKDKEIITFCSISLKGYEAALILRHAGFKDVKVLDGGIDMWPYEKIEGLT